MKRISNIFDSFKQNVFKISYINKKTEERVGSGSSFMIQGFLVTNQHVFITPYKLNHEEIVVTITSCNGKADKSVKLNYSQFYATSKAGSDENGYDFAVLDIPQLREIATSNLSFSNSFDYKVGDPVLFLGYHFEQLNLACNLGYISSLYKSKNIDMIQLDGSVNSGVSGGPLIHVESERVIGIVSRKATGLSERFKEVINNLDEHIKLFSSVKANTFYQNYSPEKVIRNTQTSLRQFSIELERSANVGIGYAISTKQLSHEAVFDSSL